ncbi:MAG: DASS family sodium-coupled anion symporter [Zoogloeaceae bacterium]|nr:DASS family sodium-coupled anion symporter [Zoogloeaceae bacterium]
MHITITALLVPILAVGFGIKNWTSSLTSFADPTVFLFFGGFALATALHVQGIDRLLANRLLLLARGRFVLTAIMLFIATALLSMWISNTATAAMMLPLALGILSNLDREKERNAFVFLLLGIAFSASIGGVGTLVGSPPNAIAASYLRQTMGLDFGFAEWMKYALPVMLVMLPVMVGVLYLVFRPDMRRSVEVKAYSFKWTRARIFTLVIFLLVASAWIFSDSLRSLVYQEKQFDSYIAVLAAVLICLLGVASWKQIQENTDWGVLFLFGGGLALSSLLKDSGADLVLAEFVKNSLGEVSPFVVMIAITTFIIALTSFVSNTAAAALLVPLFGVVGSALGLPAHILPIVIGVGASFAFLLPVSTPPNAIIYGSGYLRQKDMIKGGFFLVVASIIVVSLFARFVWM